MQQALPAVKIAGGNLKLLKHGILGLLNYHAMTGYEIMEVFRDSLRFFWNAQTSQIYRELQGLEEKGWVSKTTVPQQGRPDKNVYAITTEGREELLRWLSGGNSEPRPHNAVLMKVFFMGERSREENIRYFEGFIEYCEIFFRSLDAAEEHIKKYGFVLDNPEKALYWEMTVDYGRRAMQMEIGWAQSCIARLKGEK